MKSLVLAAVLGPALVVGAGAAATPGTGAAHAVLTGAAHAVLPGGAAARPAVADGLSGGSGVRPPGPGVLSGPTTCDGVTVVVDGGALDTAALGPVSGLGCAAADGPVTAYDAVAAAGVELQGTEQWGAAFVCRVDGRPALDEDVLRADGSVGTEPCLRTPSQGAYWALWTSTDASTWTYATRGVTSTEVAWGDVVGLVFVTSDEAMPPQVSPAEAIEGGVPQGWGALGTGGARTGPVTEGQAPGAPGSTRALVPPYASPSVDTSPGVVALVGLGLAGGLLCLAAARARGRRQ